MAYGPGMRGFARKGGFQHGPRRLDTSGPGFDRILNIGRTKDYALEKKEAAFI